MINIPKKIKISKEAQNIHGINKKDLELAPKSKNVLKHFINKFGSDYAFAGWNICFDISFFRKICIENSFNVDIY